MICLCVFLVQDDTEFPKGYSRLKTSRVSKRPHARQPVTLLGIVALSRNTTKFCNCNPIFVWAVYLVIIL